MAEGQPPAYAVAAHGYAGQPPSGQPIYVQPQPQSQYTGEGQPTGYGHPTVAAPLGYPVQGMPVQGMPVQGMPVQPQPGFGQQAYPGQQMMYVAQPMQPGVYAQPVVVGSAPAQQTVVVVNGVPQGPPTYLSFSDGIFDCFEDVGSCLLAYFVTPIRWAMTTDRANLLQFIIAVLIYGIPFWGVVALSFITIRSNWIAWGIIVAYAIMLTLGTVYRTQLRFKYNLLGSTLEDCCLHMWCTCCAVSQEARHVDRMTGRLPHSAYVQY